MAEAFELASAGLGHVAHALAGIGAGNVALPHPVIEAVGIAILDPEPLRGAKLVALLLFCLAFGAAALARLWPNEWTRWLRRNRRALGVSFAASHGLHAAAIAAFAALDQTGFAAATSIASYVFGGIGYAFIIAMTATSFDRTAQAMGPRAWRILHLTGGYYLWLQFMVSFGKRIPDMPLYGLFLIPLLVVLALRLIAMAPARTARTA